MARSGVYRRAFVSLDTTEDGKRPNQKGLAFMANIKSQKKRIITNEKRRMRNRAVKSELKTAVRHVKAALAEGHGKDAYAFACEACRLTKKGTKRSSGKQKPLCGLQTAAKCGNITLGYHNTKRSDGESRRCLHGKERSFTG